MNKDAILTQLKWSIQAMACDSEIQISLFPDFIVASDEIINDYDHWKRAMESRFKSEFSREQIDSLNQINRVIDEITQSEDEIWDNHALITHALWEELRNAGTRALNEFHWELEIPSTTRSIFL